MIESLLKKGYGVILREHPFFVQQQSCIEQWSKYTNFKMGDTKQWLDDSFLNVGVIVTDYSSMGSSFPYVGLVRSVFLNQNPGNLIKIDGIEVYDSCVSSVFSNMQEAQKEIESVLNPLTQKKTKEFLEDYREKQVYNLRKSGSFIADFIVKLMNDK